MRYIKLAHMIYDYKYIFSSSQTNLVEYVYIVIAVSHI